MTELPTPEQPAKKDSKSTLWAIGIVLVVAACCGAFVLKGRSGSDDPGVGAERACQDFVKGRLKSPASADFSKVNHTSSGSSTTVAGAVDSQNSFGANIRSNFTCKLHDEGDTWRLVSLTGIN